MSTALLIGATACSSDDNPSGEAPVSTPGPSSSSSKPSTPSSSGTTPSPARQAAKVTDLPAAQVVAGLGRAGYRCGRDGDYATCTSGPVAVWVLTGKHPRPPVVSLRSLGAAGQATAAITRALPQVLEIAHVRPAAEITTWFDRQQARPSARLTDPEWQVEWSVEVDTEEPGAHLSLMDRRCRSACATE